VAHPFIPQKARDGAEIQNQNRKPPNRFLRIECAARPGYVKGILWLGVLLPPAESASDRWLKQVRSACSDLNGRYYEITGYTQTGPEISEFHWAETAQRLGTIIGILNDQLANTTKLQQAEEEIRIVIHQLTVDLHFKKSGKRRSAHSLNAEETRKLLLSCGVDPPFVNKIKSVFETVDPAHHAQADYSPTRERIKAYYSWSKELETLVKQT